MQTPVRQITRLASTEESQEESIPQDMEAVEQKMKEMKEEVHKQQNIISQTSQALNLCSSTPEFSGSTEQVEAERVLLLASKNITLLQNAFFVVNIIEIKFL